MHLRVGGDAGFEAKVVDLVFQGPLVRVELSTVDGSSLVAHVGPDEELPLLRPGDAVRIVWDADGGRLLRRSERIGSAGVDDELS
jgi:spermidine/putrescine transport system ATP-binding protein